MAHRPIECLNDELSTVHPDPVSEYIWQAHKKRVAKGLKSLRFRLPSPEIARYDPFGLRIVPVLMLIIAGTAGVGDAWARIERAAWPKLDKGLDVSHRVDLWITPPAYTNLPPIFIESTANSLSAGPVQLRNQTGAEHAPVMQVPVGSQFLAQLTSAKKKATVAIGEREILFKAVDPNVPEAGARAEGILIPSDAGDRALSVRIDSGLAASWPLKIELDRAPDIKFVQKPKKTGRGQLNVEFQASDDFGISEVYMTIQGAEHWSTQAQTREFKVRLPIKNRGLKRMRESVSQDLTKHPWAGTKVEISIQAVDAAKQAGSTDVVGLVLPERVFNHPVARAIIKLRKMLNTPGRQIELDVANEIEKIAKQRTHFFDDTVVFLNLVFARARLLGGERASVQNLLWNTALRLEDGEFVVAERELESAQSRLMEAFEKGEISAPALDRLIKNLQKAMDQYLHALAKHLKRSGRSGAPVSLVSRLMETGDLQHMMKQMRQLGQTGSFEAARGIFSQLNKILKALRHGALTAQKSKNVGDGQKILEGLQKLTASQKDLLDQTFRKLPRYNDQFRKGKINKTHTSQLADKQNAVREGLEGLMQEMEKILGAIPSSIGKADYAMEKVGESLDRGDRSGALKQATEALDQLRQTKENLTRQMQGRRGFSFGRQNQKRHNSRDPFGRRSTNTGGMGAFGNGSLKIPNGSEIRRSRKILEELRLRSGDRDRPQMELNYINRLIRQF